MALSSSPRKVTLIWLIRRPRKYHFIWFKPLLKHHPCSGSFGIDDLLAFTAPEFHADLTVSFFVDYAQRVLVEGFELSASFKALLTASSQSNLPRHTNIVYVNFEDGHLSEAKEYVFSHEQWRPWGHRLPPSCPICSSPECWKDPVKSKSTYIFNCRSDKCAGVCLFDKQEGFEPLPGDSVAGGRWLVREYIL